MIAPIKVPLTRDQIYSKIKKANVEFLSDDFEIKEGDMKYDFNKLKKEVRALIWYLNQNTQSTFSNDTIDKMIDIIRRKMRYLEYKYTEKNEDDDLYGIHATHFNEDELLKYTSYLFYHLRNDFVLLYNELDEIAGYMNTIGRLKSQVEAEKNGKDQIMELFGALGKSEEYAIEKIAQGKNKERIVCMYCFYNGIKIIKDNASRIGGKFEVKASQKLEYMYMDVEKDCKRVGFSRFASDFLFVYPLLDSNAKEKADKDVILYKEKMKVDLFVN
ncbi:hypothetical protein [Marinifilum sp.]|uniref:hypothetical protein n=1 Tax=Marinifilum sp. TaxID=2033137 RepID=UPI003BAB5C4E